MFGKDQEFEVWDRAPHSCIFLWPKQRRVHQQVRSSCPEKN